VRQLRQCWQNGWAVRIKNNFILIQKGTPEGSVTYGFKARGFIAELRSYKGFRFLIALLLISCLGFFMTTQIDIADHLDMSDRNLREVLKKLNLDHRKHSKDEIRIAYIRHLRDQASGRGGEDQASLTKARTREARINADSKELQYFKDVGLLVPVEEIEPVLTSWAVLARSETTNALNKIRISIESKYNIKIDQDLIDGPLVDAFAAIANYPKNNGCNVVEDGGEVDTAA